MFAVRVTHRRYHIFFYSRPVFAGWTKMFKSFRVESMHFQHFSAMTNSRNFLQTQFRRFTIHCCSVNFWKVTCTLQQFFRIPTLCSLELSRKHALSDVFCNGEFVQGMHFPAFTVARLIVVRPNQCKWPNCLKRPNPLKWPKRLKWLSCLKWPSHGQYSKY